MSRFHTFKTLSFLANSKNIHKCFHCSWFPDPDTARQHFFENIDCWLYSGVWETVKTRLKTMERLTGSNRSCMSTRNLCSSLNSAVTWPAAQLKREMPGEHGLKVSLFTEIFSCSQHTWSLHQSPEAGSQNTQSFKSFSVVLFQKVTKIL